MTAGRIDVAFEGQLGSFDLAVAFTVPAAGVTALFGPSGCGKTTVLRAVAGLTRLRGHCRVSDAVWQAHDRFIPTHRRPIGYVFQDASLFPHLTVEGNLLYAGRGARPQEGSGQVGFDETVDLLGLRSLLGRAPAHLSGGERQRVAIGRALLTQPRLLLMDEPLSALDRASRDDILPLLERMRDRLAIPVLYVSHDMTEVERLADTLVLLQAGRVLAVGPLDRLQTDPRLPLAIGRDAAVSLEGTVAEIDAAYGLLRLATRSGLHFTVPGRAEHLGEHRRLRVAAGDVSLCLTPPVDSSVLNVVPVEIASHAPAGAHEILVVLQAGTPDGGTHLLARITRLSWERLALRDGTRLHAQIKGVALVPRAAPEP